MDYATRQQRWFWATLTLSSISIVALVFAIWELVEYPPQLPNWSADHINM